MSKKIIQIAVSNNEVYGLCENGSLVRFDHSIGKFVLKCECEIASNEEASFLKRVEPRIPELGRYRAPKEIENQKATESRIMITPLIAGVGIIGFIILAIFFLR